MNWEERKYRKKKRERWGKRGKERKGCKEAKRKDKSGRERRTRKKRGLAKRTALPRTEERSRCTLLSGSRFTRAKASDYYRPC